MWGLFGADFVNDVEMYPDAIGEFLNMLVGNVGRSLEKEGIKARGEAPIFIEEVPIPASTFASLLPTFSSMVKSQGLLHQAPQEFFIFQMLSSNGDPSS